MENFVSRMTVFVAPENITTVNPVKKGAACYHCGEKTDTFISEDDRYFCCEGCKFVYGLLKDNGLCNYYELSNTPGIRVRGKFSSEKFAYLDNEVAQEKLIQFTDGKQNQVTFYLPQMHCASCIWLLENLHAIQPGILYSKTNFQRKELSLAFETDKTSLRKLVELLTFIGYEPYISFDDSGKKEQKKINRQQFYKIGVAGFCFSNIMMLSFPEYFSSGNIDQQFLKHLFSYLNLLLALPVFFYSASGFFVSAWKGLQQKWLNIDAPIALSILITFSRSVYEVLSGTGAGYFDSMSGVVLFMLAGRWFQNRTYDSFSFDRDYKSYFPLGVTRITEDGAEEPVTINVLKKNDHIIVRNGEMVPADAVLVEGDANIDYSFVSGENTPVQKKKGELIYAGAKQLGGSIELEVVQTVSQSYITQLWNNNDVFAEQKNKDKSFIHPWSRYFTVILFTIAASTGVYWWIVNPANILPAVTASLIVACPCSLLLSATFTFGNMLRHYGKNKLYLKNSSVIESLSNINTIVFDKTGTLTHSSKANIIYYGQDLSNHEQARIFSLLKESAHPLSRLLKEYYVETGATHSWPVTNFQEIPGKGIEGDVNGAHVRIGSLVFLKEDSKHSTSGTQVWLAIDHQIKGYYHINNSYRKGMNEMLKKLKQHCYDMHLLSGDNTAEKDKLHELFGSDIPLLFNQTPQNKLDYIKELKEQDKSSRILMLGDGLNDAGALKQSDVGIAVTENTSQFTPASDAILDSGKLHLLHSFISYARAGKRIVLASFIISILYNCVGLSFAVQAKLSPMVAAILMPISSITIVTFVSIASSISAKRKGL